MKSDINLRINELAIRYFNGNNSKFAEFLETSEANIRNYRTKTEPKIEMLNKISTELEISYEWLLSGQGSMTKKLKGTDVCQLCIAKDKKILELQEKLIKCQEQTISILNNKHQKNGD